MYYVEIEQNGQIESLILEKPIEHTTFSVVKPINEMGMAAVFVTGDNQMVVRNYNEVTNKEIKKERYSRICFVTAERFPVDFTLKLNSELAELLMQATLKCQMKIKDYKAIAVNPQRDIGEDMIQEITTRINDFLTLSNKAGIELIHELCAKIPELIKESECSIAVVEGCRLANIQISEKGKKDKIKENVLTAFNENDLFELYENKQLVQDLLEIKRMITKAGEEDKINSLANENKYYDLMLEKYTKLKESGLLPADVTINAFMDELKKADNVFDKVLLHETKQETENSEGKSETEEKAYFE